MSLAPEKLAYFRIAVPSQYESDLLKALAAVGKIHLEEPLEAERILPKYFLEILEGKVTYTSLNIDEALEAARKVLRPGDTLLTRIEERVNELKRLQALRALAERLGSLGIVPETIGQVRYRNLLDLVFVSEEDLTSASLDFTKSGAIVRKVRLMPHTYAMLLTYTQEKKPIIDELKKTYGKEFNVPAWFFDKLDVVEAKINEEEARARKELLDLLIDAASALRDAIEFERVARRDALESARKAAEEVRELLPRLERVVLRAIALKLATEVYTDEKLATVLAEVIKPRDASNIVSHLVKNAKIDTKRFRKVIVNLGAGDNLTESAVTYNALLAAINLTRGLQPTDHDFLLLACGPRDVKEDLRKDKLAVYNVSILADKLDEDCYAAVLRGSEGLLRKLAEHVEEKGAVAFVEPFTSEGVKKLERNISLRIEVEKGKILVAVLSLWLEKQKANASEVLKQIGNEVAVKVWGAYERLTSEEPAPSLPQNISELLKAVIASADETVAGIQEISTELDNLLDLPLPVLRDKVPGLLEKVMSLLSEAYLVVKSAGQLEVISKVQTMIREVRIFRDKRITVVEGYVPSKEKEKLQAVVSQNVPRVLYFKVVDVPRREEAPTYVEAKGLWRYLQPLTFMRGVPAYWELNPTLFFTALFTIMYGMMFGDVGQGLLILLFGAWLLKTRYRLLGISEEGAATLGALALLAGVSSMAFGALYGFVVFLKPLAHPVISPVHDVYEIIAVALWFGAAQLLLGITLNIANLLRYGDRMGALFSGMGGMGLLFYVPGIIIAYNLATSGFNTAVLSEPGMQPFILCMAASLISVMAFGVYEAKVKGEGEKLMHALSELIELIVALPANSLSYIRLAAFAMGHEAFSVLAESMGKMFGEVASYIIANMLVLAIETLAVGIQSLRLTYYEFSSKFFKGEGVEFRPILSSK